MQTETGLYAKLTSFGEISGPSHQRMSNIYQALGNDNQTELLKSLVTYLTMFTEVHGKLKENGTVQLKLARKEGWEGRSSPYFITTPVYSLEANLHDCGQSELMTILNIDESDVEGPEFPDWEQYNKVGEEEFLKAYEKKITAWQKETQEWETNEALVSLDGLLVSIKCEMRK